MSEDSLTYRASGVDVEANLEANRRIQAYARRTSTDQVLTRGGLFGGAVKFPTPPEAPSPPFLSGSLIAPPGNGGDGPEKIAAEIARACRSREFPSRGAADSRPLAFLDYLAAARLDADRAADLVGIFSEVLGKSPRIPIIGGETAEMPDVFQAEGWEVVGALFSTGGASGEAVRGQPGGGQPGSGQPDRVDLGAFRDLRQPALVFSMDGVGTKTKIGVALGRTAGLAEDIIHHSLDDILCQGARGIGFMLYLGCHSRDERLIDPVIEAARQCCRDNGIVLLDCLVREKPRLYRPGEIDVCGAIAGVMDAAKLIQGEGILAGDLLVGLGSSGLHTNGYSLARKALLERGGLELDRRLEELGTTVGDALLVAHRNYAPLVLPLLEEPGTAGSIKGIAHITGGGLKDNLERILPPSVRAEIRRNSWQTPPVFQLIRRSGNIPLTDPVGKGMYESFNMGIGLVLVVAPEHADKVLEQLRGRTGGDAVVIGRVVEAAEGAPAPGGRVVLV
jgi:phosphoribosylformylglycinamidine cyclo-ligase